MLNQIEKRLPDLSRAEQRVARFVLRHPRQAANSKLAAMAAACDTSEPTVIRFCRHLGLSGFRQFTIRLTESLSSPALFVHRSVSREDKTPDAVAKVMDASIRALMDVRARATSMPFDAAIEKLLETRQLIFLGLGASGRVASDASHKFFRLSIPSSAATDAPTVLQLAAVSQSNDVFVMISHSGKQAELIQASQSARRRGTFVIALTDPASKLADNADLVFDCRVPGDQSLYTPQSSRLAHLAILDALQVALALAMGEAATTHLRNSKAALESTENDA